MFKYRFCGRINSDNKINSFPLFSFVSLFNLFKLPGAIFAGYVSLTPEAESLPIIDYAVANHKPYLI